MSQGFPEKLNQQDVHLSVCACTHTRTERETAFKELLSCRGCRVHTLQGRLAAWRQKSYFLWEPRSFSPTAFYLLDEAHPHYER